MIKKIGHFLMEVSSLKYFLTSVVLALLVWPIEDMFPTVFVMTRLLSFVLFFVALVKFSSKK